MAEKSTCATTVAAYLSKLVAESDKTQRQISEETGFESPNLITMIKNGTSKLPINRIANLAKSLSAVPIRQCPTSCADRHGLRARTSSHTACVWPRQWPWLDSECAVSRAMD